MDTFLLLFGLSLFAIVALGVWSTARRMWRARCGERRLLHRRRRICRVYHRVRYGRRLDFEAATHPPRRRQP